MRLALAFACLAAPLTAQSIDAILDEHVQPRAEALSESTAALAAIDQGTCVADPTRVEAGYHAVFDAWMGYGHLRFGPTEAEERGFAMAFWPDSRGATPRALGALLTDDLEAMTDQEFSEVSVAARGLYAFEFLLFDETILAAHRAEARCLLIGLIARDMAANAAAMAAEWRGPYGDLMRNVGQNDLYRSKDEALQAFFTALATGLEFTAQMRLGRPLGTFDRPRPNRAEAHRSERSLRNVVLSLVALGELAALLSEDDAGLGDPFAEATRFAQGLDDPIFAGVAQPGTRVRVEALQQRVETIRRLVLNELGPRLGIAAGFNALDGD